jgi:hypothetical protein
VIEAYFFPLTLSLPPALAPPLPRAPLVPLCFPSLSMALPALPTRLVSSKALPFFLSALVSILLFLVISSFFFAAFALSFALFDEAGMRGTTLFFASGSSFAPSASLSADVDRYLFVCSAVGSQSSVIVTVTSPSSSSYSVVWVLEGPASGSIH